MDGPAMDEAAMAQYADWLDNLERTDPEGYQQLLATMKAQIESGGDGIPAPPPQQQRDADAALFEMLGSATKSSGASDFTPRFPGNKVMEATGLATKQEGMYIDVQPGFVMKTRETKSGKKVFVNVCFSDSIQTFSQQKKLDDDGNEQDGIHVPLSLGAPHEVTDKSGNAALAFDVAVNTQVVDDCRQDPTGAFRNFVCELAIEYIDQKYKVQLDARYKLPRLAYSGALPPPKHYIRKTQAPKIQEVAPAAARAASSKQPQSASARCERSPASTRKTATARCEVYGVENAARSLCTRVAAVEKLGTALSPDVLARAPSELDACVFFESPVRAAGDVELELRSELLVVKASGHQDLSVFLPYPVVVASAHVELRHADNSLRLRFTVDRTWDTTRADSGSTPWLLAQALASGTDADGSSTSGDRQSPDTAPPAAKSLAELFHLELRDDADTSLQRQYAAPPTKWDPVDEDEELPEDRFHRKDMMSMHILEQRKAERAQKAKDADAKRQAQRAEVLAKQQRAREAGKTWREMYPNEPETTYIDMDDLMQQQRERRDASSRQDASKTDPLAKTALEATEDARKAAAAWSETQAPGALDLRSALAFDLLE